MSIVQIDRLIYYFFGINVIIYIDILIYFVYVQIGLVIDGFILIEMLIEGYNINNMKYDIRIIYDSFKIRLSLFLIGFF